MARKNTQLTLFLLAMTVVAVMPMSKAQTQQQAISERNEKAEIQSQMRQIALRKGIYDMPLDMLEQSLTRQTSAEVTEIKVNEYLRREAIKNWMADCSLNEAQKSQLTDIIKSEEGFDNRLEIIRIKKVAQERTRKITRTVRKFVHGAAAGGAQAYSTALRTPPLAMPTMQPVSSIPMSKMTNVNVNGRWGSVVDMPTLSDFGGTSRFYGPAFYGY